MATVTRLHACVWAAASIVYFSLASLDATASPAPAATWVKQAPLPTPYDLAGVDMISETEGWAVGEAGTILHTTDGGVTWTEQASGTVEALHAVKFLFMAPLILAFLVVINLMTSPGHWWVQWAALGLGIAWVINLFRVARFLVLAGGLAALTAYLANKR